MMNRRNFLKSSSGLIISQYLLSKFAYADLSRSTSSSKPNVIFFLTDDLGWNDVACYGNDRVEIPNIDKLAKKGIRFTNAHTPASICTPTRYSFLTGRYCWRTWLKKGVIANTPLLIEPGSDTLPAMFQRHGYNTACIGKWHLGTRMVPPDEFDGDNHFIPPIHPGPNEIGFDYFFGMPVGHFYPPYVYMENDTIYNYDENDPIRLVRDPKAGNRGYLQEGGKKARYKEDQVGVDLTLKAKEWIKKNKSSPFFMYFATSSPHDPYTPGKQFTGKSKLGPYGDFLLEIDWTVGQLIDTLKEQGLEDNTLFIFTSDNGASEVANRELEKYQYNPNGKWRGDKGDIYEGGLRVPFIAHWPDAIKAGQENDQLFSLVDMYATMAGVFGEKLEPTAGVDSYNMFDAFKGKSNLHPERAIILHSRGGMYALTRGNWKYIHGQGDGELTPDGYPQPDEDAAGQLFNLKVDPYEKNNVIEDNPEIAGQMKRLLKTYAVSGTSRI